jgi:predicted nucleic acid-binding protein
MIILDTNVVSEMWRPLPNRSLVAWLKAQPAASLYMCSPVLAELRFGAERLGPGGRRDRLRASIDHLEYQGYRGRILFLDGAAASEFGRLAATRERAGHRMGLMDGLIAAIALANGAGIATRDIDGFTGLDIKLINPFEFDAV